MTTEPTPPKSHLHFFNHHTGRPRFHFDAVSDAAAATAAAAAGGGAKPWHDGVEPEVLGFWQNKGLPLDDPKTFASKLTEQYRAAEKHIGAPPDQLVRLPKADSKPEEISAFRQRIGVPAEAKDYDFTAIKDGAGQPLAQPLADAMRASFHAHGITKDAAPAVALDVVKALDSIKTTQATLSAGKLADEKLTLEKNWGGKESATYQFNHLQAMEGARRLGITPEAVKALESQIGYSSVMDAMRKVGAARSEDIFVNPPSGGGPNGQVTTREGAMARKTELMADRAWAARFTAGDAECRREYDRLNTMIHGDAA
jgi:hypothetical protein